MSRCDSAAMVSKTSELLPEPDTPVNTVSRRLGISILTFLRLFSRAPTTRMTSWLSGILQSFTAVVRLTGNPLCSGLEGNNSAQLFSTEQANLSTSAANLGVGYPYSRKGCG